MWCGGRKARGTRSGDSPPSRPPAPPCRRAPPPGARVVGGSRRVPGAAGHEAPPPAARSRGTHFVQDAASPLIVGPGPPAALVRARNRSARRTAIPVRGADPAEDPGETFLSRGERARPGAARGMRDCARRRRGPGPGAGAGRRAVPQQPPPCQRWSFQMERRTDSWSSRGSGGTQIKLCVSLVFSSSWFSLFAAP
ncbi:E3 ubiquitin-protein ligase MARCH11-like [Lontra canadensis]|uniref:E3 ubiquitin-protein ligase MARCH11-like n=1 Tax=Lontra canadensis TaxID=76717 RepID=UPI0013F3895B|nr:E3 ubiquitin-protein ligase MARCH11-like [Lontra canadensis]